MARFYSSQTANLANINGVIGEAVPASFTMLRPFGHPIELAGGTLGTIVREHAIQSIEAVPSSTFSGLWFSVGPNRSLVFKDMEGNEVRVRKRPVDWKRKRLVPFPEVEQLQTLTPTQLELLRPASAFAGEELVILWKPDPLSATLDRAVLAAVHNIENSSKTRVIDFVNLPDPPVSMNGLGVPPPPEPGDFEDFFGPASGILGPDSA